MQHQQERWGMSEYPVNCYLYDSMLDTFLTTSSDIGRNQTLHMAIIPRTCSFMYWNVEDDAAARSALQHWV